MSRINDTKCSGTLSVTPDPAYYKLCEKKCNSEVNHPSHQFQDERFGDVEPQADYPSTTPVS